MLHLAARDTPVGAEIDQHWLARLGSRCEEPGIERREGELRGRLARVKHERERCDRDDTDCRAYHQEWTPRSSFARNEAEINSDGGRVVRQYSRHQVVRHDRVEEVERQPDQHEAEQMLDPGKPFARARQTTDVPGSHREPDVWDA